MSLKESNDAVIQVSNQGLYDISFDDDGDIKTENFLDTAIIMSLFCERRATPSEVPIANRRRGWIGNESTPDFEIGSKVWLYEQARITQSTIAGIQTEAENGYQWFVDDNIADSFDVNVSVSGVDTLALNIDFFRNGSKIDSAFFPLWENTGVR